MAKDVICNEYLNPLTMMSNELQNGTGECISFAYLELMEWCAFLEAQSNECEAHSFKQEESSL